MPRVVPVSTCKLRIKTGPESWRKMEGGRKKQRQQYRRGGSIKFSLAMVMGEIWDRNKTTGTAKEAHGKTQAHPRCAAVDSTATCAICPRSRFALKRLRGAQFDLQKSSPSADMYCTKAGHPQILLGSGRHLYQSQANGSGCRGGCGIIGGR